MMGLQVKAVRCDFVHAPAGATGRPLAATRAIARLLFAVFLVAMFGMKPGCMDGTNGEQWSTRDQSIIAARPALSPEDELFRPITVATEHNDLREAAIELLQQASDSSSPLLRANALEAMQGAPEHVRPMVQRFLADDNRGVRFIAAMTAGQHELCDLKHVIQPLLTDQSQSVQAAAIFALRQCGEDADLNPLASMINSSDPEVKANAAMVLAELGNPSAVPMIRAAARRDMPRVPSARVRVVDLQLAEAMVRLGEDRELEVIRASLFAPAEQGELVALACMMIGRLGDARAVPNLVDLATREGDRQLAPEIRLAALAALTRIDPGRVPEDVALQYVRSNRYEVRAQTASTLGHIPGSASINALRLLLNDSNPMVQIAAAGGILQHQAATSG